MPCLHQAAHEAPEGTARDQVSLPNPPASWGEECGQETHSAFRPEGRTGSPPTLLPGRHVLPVGAPGLSAPRTDTTCFHLLLHP